MNIVKNTLSIIKKINYGRVALYTVGWIAFLFIVFGLLATGNDIKTTDSGNVAIYPSVFKSIMLFLDAHPFWAFVTVALTFIAAAVFEAMRDDLIDFTVGLVVFGVMAPLVLGIGASVGPAYRIQSFTHHTISADEFKKAKEEKKNLNDYFYLENQPDSLFGK